MAKITEFRPRTASLEQLLTDLEDDEDTIQCTEHKCIKDDEKMRIECHKCHMPVQDCQPIN